MKKFKVLISICAFLFICILCTEVFAFPPSGSTLYDGIDVSEWQGNINFEGVKNSGIEVVYIRASEGFNYTDPYYFKNYNGAKQYGLKVGFYHYVTARNTRRSS